MNKKINTNLTTVLKKEHEKKWVALSSDRRKVISSNENLVELRNEIGDRKDVVYMKVLSSEMEFAF